MKTNYIRFLLLFSLILLYIPANGSNLLTGRQSSYETYIYKITDKEAYKINKKGIDKIDDSYFHTLSDTYPTDSVYNKKLPTGHYIKTYTHQNKQYIFYTYVPDFDVMVLNNNTDLYIQVYDLKGAIIKEAEVKIGNKKLRFDSKTLCYILKKSNKKGLLTVTYQSNTTYYQLNRSYNNSALKRSTQTVLYKTPLKYVWQPVNFVLHVPIDAVKSINRGYSRGTIRSIGYFFERGFEKINCWFDGDYCDDYSYEKKIKGYFVINKPKYLPGDTVKLKTFIVNKNGKPIHQNLDLWLHNGNRYIKISELKPYRKGAFEYQFFLHDSLRMQLDQKCTVSLKDRRRRTYSSASFMYEEYELSKIKLEVRSPQKEHYVDTPFKVYLKATDENNLNLMDARVQIYARSTQTNNYFETYTFIPDTLFCFEKELKPRGETEVIIPDSVFPKANFNYQVSFKLLTSDNQSFTESDNYLYYYKKKEFDIQLENDSIAFTYYENGKPAQTFADIVAVDHFGNVTLIASSVTFPCKELLNPYYKTYTIKGKQIKKSFDISRESSLITCLSARMNDSIRIEIKNLRKLRFTYNIYIKNSEKDRGTAIEYLYNEKVSSKQNYYISLRYLWGGQIKEETFRVPFIERKLNIKVDQPGAIYPGQKTNVEITVTDQKGKPVEGVDLTAYSLTKKFDYQSPFIPGFEKKHAEKKVINNFRVNPSNNLSTTHVLEYQYWQQLAALDSIEYYKFLYPGNKVYQYNYPVQNKITQLAPFVVNNEGNLLPVHVIYIDNRPVYFSWTTNKDNPYSFQTTSGKHQIKLRLSDRIITLDNIQIIGGQKNIICLQNDLQNKNCWYKECEPKLSNEEQRNLYRYIFTYRHTFGNQYALLKEDERIFLLNSPENYNYERIIGPVNGELTFNLFNSYSSRFINEPYFEYEIKQGLIKMREVKKNKYPVYLNQNRIPNLDDEVITQKSIEKGWNDYTDKMRRNYVKKTYSNVTKSGNGLLQLEYLYEHEQIKREPLNHLLFRYDNADFNRMYEGNCLIMNDLKEGYYQLFTLFTNNNYLITDSVYIKPNGINYQKISVPMNLRNDNFSQRMNKYIVDNLFDQPTFAVVFDQLYDTYQRTYKFTVDGEWISGKVIDKSTREPLIGVIIQEKGTTNGTITDMYGNYAIKVSADKNKLVFSYIGFNTFEMYLETSNITLVELEENLNVLNEVIVVGYGTTRREFTQPTVNISNALAGKVSGVIGNENSSFYIRGISTMDTQQSPLYIIDGMVYTGDISKLNASELGEMVVLKDASATAIYGARGADGVVLITTKSGGGFIDSENAVVQDEEIEFPEMSSQSNSIRNNFSDYAFWQPRLITNKEGKASFEITFPDDVTNWSTYVLAMNDNKQTGQTQGSIRSFKPLMAQLSLPNFLIENDQTNSIGKTLNYTTDTIKVTTSFEVQGKNVFVETFLCANSKIDTLAIDVSKIQEDSISIQYSMKKADGYLDGELRKIPVFPLGLEESKGVFMILDKDTTFHLNFDDPNTEVHLYAESEFIDIIKTETTRLINYRYMCNEQLASKLKGLLAEKSIAEYQVNKWNRNRDVDKLIKHILKGRNSSGLWGWWEQSGTDYYFSSHIIETLLQAKRQGYSVNVSNQTLQNNLIFNLEQVSDNSNRINILRTLKELNTTLDYKSYVTKISENKNLSLNNYLKLMELNQWLGISVNTDTLNTFKHETMFGNIYFQDVREKKNEYHLTDNIIQNTLLAYRILRNENVNSNELTLNKIKFYLLEKKTISGWRNTYETAQIISTILPDILKGKKKVERSQLTIYGDLNEKISKFPLDTVFIAQKGLTITKSGDDPVYFTTYQRYWNKTPEEKKGDFIIQTHFEGNKGSALQAGKPVKLMVDLEVAKDAEYLMINIPIPAGCSYAQKGQGGRFEIHREYFKHETTIFSQQLKKGKYTFEIDLMPRYTGIYTLNPAKAELMYFPLFNGNNAIKQINIE